MVTAKGVRLHSANSDDRSSSHSLTPIESSALIPAPRASPSEMDTYEMQENGTDLPEGDGNLDDAFRKLNDMSGLITNPTLRKFESSEYLNLSLHQVTK